MKKSKETNPFFSLSMAGQSSAYFETAVFMTMLMNATTGTLPLNYIKTFFGMYFVEFGMLRGWSELTSKTEEERIPYSEGWRPVNFLATFQLAGNILQLALNTDEDSPANTYAAVTPHMQRSAGFHHGFQSDRNDSSGCTLRPKKGANGALWFPTFPTYVIAVIGYRHLFLE